MKRNNDDFPRNSEADGQPMPKACGDIEKGVPEPIRSLKIRICVDQRPTEHSDLAAVSVAGKSQLRTLGRSEGEKRRVMG